MKLQIIIILLIINISIPPAFGQASACGLEVSIKTDKSLVITDLEVVDHPWASSEGPWSFHNIFKSVLPLSNNLDKEIGELFSSWKTTEQINNFEVKTRRPGTLTTLWPKNTENYIDSKQAPFNLLAIVFRPDLASIEAPNGEGRFVFGGLDVTDDHPIDLTIIFEFTLSENSMEWNWQEQIALLSSLEGNAYLNQLKQLTDRILAPNEDGRSRISQVRTNETYMGNNWEFREFKIENESQKLIAAPTAQTPDPSLLNSDSELMNWIFENAEAIVADDYKIPTPMLAGSSLLIDETFKWGLDTDLPEPIRHQLSFNTCSGCHGGETGTRFLHLEPRSTGETSRLSPFLKDKVIERAKQLENSLCNK